MTDIFHKIGGTLELISDADLKIGGHLIPFGSEDELDFDGEFFDEHTKAIDEWFKQLGQLVMLGHHDKLPQFLKMMGVDTIPEGITLNGPIGTIYHFEKQAKGWYAEAILKALEKSQELYVDLMVQAAKRGLLNWSSGPLQQRVGKRELPKGKYIAEWPVIEGTVTSIPSSPYDTFATPLKSVLSAYTLLGIPAEKMLKVDGGESSTVGETQLSDGEKIESVTAVHKEASVNDVTDRIFSAFRMQQSQLVQPPHHDVYPMDRFEDSIVICLDDRHFRVPYVDNGEAVVFAPAAEWVEVRKEWVAVGTSAEATPMDTDDYDMKLAQARAKTKLYKNRLKMRIL